MKVFVEGEVIDPILKSSAGGLYRQSSRLVAKEVEPIPGRSWRLGSRLRALFLRFVEAHP